MGENIALVFQSAACLFYFRVGKQPGEVPAGPFRRQILSFRRNTDGDFPDAGENRIPVSLCHNAAAACLHCCGDDFFLSRVNDLNSPCLGALFRTAGHMPDIFFQGLEFIFLEKVGYGRVIFHIHGHVFCLRFQRKVCLYCDQSMAQCHVVLRLFEGRPLFRREFVKMAVDIFHRPESGNQLACADFPDSLYAGDIVRGVPAYGEHVDYLLRRADAVPAADFLLVKYFAVCP